MNFTEIENGILANRGNKAYMDNIIAMVQPIKQQYDWEMNKFLEDHVRGVEGLKELDLDNSNPKHRYYQHKCNQYAAIERIIRIAKAFS